MQREQTAEEVLNQSIYPQMRKLTTTEQTQLEKCTCASLGLWPANKKNTANAVKFHDCNLILWGKMRDKYTNRHLVNGISCANELDK